MLYEQAGLRLCASRLLICLMGWGAAATAFAQPASFSATLSGVATDESGKALSGLTVRAVDTERGQASGTLTDREGRFQMLWLRPGSYEVRVDDPRFAPLRREVTLLVGRSLQVTLRLQVASQQTRIEVTSDAPALDTVRAQVADSVRPAEIDALPLNGRNYVDLALLAPGVSRTNTGAPQQFAETSAVPGTGISFSSQRNLNNNFVLDGLSINDDAAGLAGTFFSQEVISEFQTVSGGASAEFGRASSGTLNIASKSGTNLWHGRVYGFVRNQRFDARNALATREEPLTQAQYGASLGGPLAKDRTFLYSNFEQSRRNAAGFVTIAPGNVAAINRALDGFGATGPRIGTGAFATGWDSTNFFARGDHRINSRHHLMMRYSLYDLGSGNARGAGALNDASRGTRLDTRDQGFAVTEVGTLSPSLVNEIRFQFTRSRLAAPGNDLSGPAVNISGVANFGASTTSPVGRDNDMYELSDSVSMVRGAHTVRMGGGLLWNRLNIYFPGSQIAAVYSFASLAAFEAGRYQTFQQAFGDPYQFQSNPNVSWFAQDEWRAAPSLTVHAGVRYDWQGLPKPMRAGTNNVSPRFGLAWAPGQRKTVVRAGYGLFYDRIPLRATSNALQRDGSRYRVALLSFGQQGAPVFPFQLSEFPAGQYINITTMDPGIQASYAHQASVQVEREINGVFNISAGYQWVRGLHLILSRNANVPRYSAAEAAALGIPNLGRPDSRYGNVSRFESSGDSYYNGLLVASRARAGRWAEMRLSYTLSKGIDNTGNFFFSSPQDNFNLRGDRGLSDNDQRHRVTATAVLTSPVTRSPGLLRAVAANWQLAPLFTYTSRLPFNVLAGTDLNNDTNLNDRPRGLGRNTGRGFDFASLDLRLSRTFPISERWSVQAIAESFNTLNRANAALPNAVFGTALQPRPAFGTATAMNNPRQLQFALRVSF